MDGKSKARRFEWYILYFYFRVGLAKPRVPISKHRLKRVGSKSTLFLLLFQACLFTTIFLIIFPKDHILTILTAITSGVMFSAYANVERVARAVGKG